MSKEDAIKKEPVEETRVIMLPLTREKQDDVFVGVNGRTWQLKRGVQIEVPLCVAEVLDNSQKMDALALQRQRAVLPKKSIE